MTAIAAHMETYLRDYLAKQKGASQYTCETYACSFQLLFNFASQRLKIPPSSLALEQIDAPLITDFLEYLEETKGNSPSTRNTRLAAIKSFFHFLEYRQPASLEQGRRIFAIVKKKTVSKLVNYLTREESQAILKIPNSNTKSGVRDIAIIQLMLATGIRVSELTGLRVDELTLAPAPVIFIRGKGRKERSLPLWQETVSHLRAWLTVRGAVQVPELFVNNRNEPLSRWGIAHLLKKYKQLASLQCISLKQKNISPHSLRHSCAIAVLQATKDIRKVALWLGHSSTQTTEVYLRADLTEKLGTINLMTPPNVKKGKFHTVDSLMAILKG
jgi:site-specific recombinase XerD